MPPTPPPPPTPPAAFEYLVLDSPAALGPLVHSLREGKRLTRAALAARAGVGPRFIYDLERGKPTLRIDKVLAVMRALELVGMVVELRAMQGALPGS